MDAAMGLQGAGLKEPVRLTGGTVWDSLRIEEASISDRQVVRVRATWTRDRDPAPEALGVSLRGKPLGEALRSATNSGPATYQMQYDLADDTLLPETAQVMVEADGSWAEARLGGRLGPALGWFADATWTAHPDIVSALGQPQPSVLLVGELLPETGSAEWLPVANLANAVRQAGYRPVLLHFGEAAACARNVAPLLLDFDVVHHHTTALPQQGWDPSAPGALPPVDRGLAQTASAIAEACGAVMVVAVSPAGLNLLGKLPAAMQLGALLPRGFVLAPRMIFNPVPREKAAATLRGILSRVTAIVEDEGLRLELAKWLPGAPAAVLPPGVAVPPLPRLEREASVVIAIGSTAAEAVSRDMPPPKASVLVDASAPLDLLLASLARAECLVLWTDSGLPGLLARRLAGMAGVPVIGLPASPLPHTISGEAEVAALVAMLAEFRSIGTALAPEQGPSWTASGFAADLGLARPGQAPELEVPSFVSRLLSMRLDGLPGRDRVGLLVEPHQPGAVLLAAACRAVLGEDRVFARNPARGSGLRTLAEALDTGIDSLLIDLGPDRDAGTALMDRVVDCGLLPLPLTPQASWTDRQDLMQWRNREHGKVAYVGHGRAPGGADLVLAPGGAVPRADAVELSGPADPRRGRLLTLFPANDDAFWRRPPAPAIGYDRDIGAEGLSLLSGLAVRHDAVTMLALALHLGCGTVLLPDELAGHPDLADALATLQKAGVAVMPVATEAH
jgi:hypothetical protein